MRIGKRRREVRRLAELGYLCRRDAVLRLPRGGCQGDFLDIRPTEKGSRWELVFVLSQFRVGNSRNEGDLIPHLNHKKNIQGPGESTVIFWLVRVGRGSRVKEGAKFGFHVHIRH